MNQPPNEPPAAALRARVRERSAEAQGFASPSAVGARPPATDPERERRLQVLERFLSPERRARLDHIVANRVESVTVLVDGIIDLGNASAIMRSCEALGLHRLFVVDRGWQHKKPSRSAQGAHKWLDVRVHRSAAESVAAARALGFRLVGATLEGASRSLRELDCRGRIAFVLGAEHEGLSAEMLACCDETYYIPMYGLTQSFNVAVAAAITLHDVLERRAALRPAETPRGDLSPADAELLREEFYRRALHNADAILAHELGCEPPPLSLPNLFPRSMQPGTLRSRRRQRAKS